MCLKTMNCFSLVDIACICRKAILDSVEASGIFDIELTVYSDENLENKLGSKEVVSVPNYIFAKVELVNVDPEDSDLHVQVCEAMR